MKGFYLTAAALTLLGGSALLAKGVPMSRIEAQAAMERVEKARASKGMVRTHVELAPAVRASKEGTCTVAFENMSDDFASIKYVFAFTDGYCCGLSSNGTMKLNPGTYTFVARGELEDWMDARNVIFVVEDYDVSGESQTCPVDFAQCTRELAFRVTLPDGSIATASTLSGDDYVTVLEQGNTLNGTWELYMDVQNSLQTITNGVAGDKYRIDDDWVLDDEECGDLLVNPGVTGVTFYQSRLAITEKGGVFTTLMAKPSDSGLITNSTDGFEYFETGFQSTPAAQGDGALVCSGYSDLFVNHGQPRIYTKTYMADWGMGIWPNTHKLWINFNREAAENGFEMYAIPLTFEVEGKDYLGLSEEHGITGNPLSNLAGQMQNVYFHAFNVEGSSHMRTVDDPYHSVLPLHANYSFAHDSETALLGNSVPVCVSCSRWKNDDRIDRNSWTGRLGETRHSDRTLQNSRDREEDGMMKTRIVNQNIVVDGINATNVADICHYPDGADTEAPTVTMLQFRNAETGAVSDRFNDQLEGVFYLNAADFEFVKVEGIEVHDVSKPQVEVWYAPEGSEEWTAVPVDDNPDFDMLPSWGYGFKGSLAGVDSESHSNWYSMKITVKDDEGNYQTQTLSHAFKLNGITGAPRPSVGGAEVRWFTPDGLEVTAPGKGLYIMVGKDGETRKVAL